MRKKKRTSLPLLILCLLLAVALVVSLVFLRNAKKDVALLEEQLKEPPGRNIDYASNPANRTPARKRSAPVSLYIL